jgi:immune inhibitor A
MADNMLASSPRVALVQADCKNDLEKGVNRGDVGDVFPGSTNNTSFTPDSSPNSNAYDGTDSSVSIKNIGEKMLVDISVGFTFN